MYRFSRRQLPAVVLLGTLLSTVALSACSDPGAAASGGSSTGAATTAARNGVVYNTSPDQQRIRADKDAALAAKVPALIGKDGKLTVATTAGSIPLSFHATDDKTPIGSEIDLAQLVADKLGLELDIQVTSWENWPLKTQSGDFEAVFSNVGINKDRVKLFDFASYRAAFMGFERNDSKIQAIREPKDVAGLRIVTDAGTNQEKILLAWDRENVAHGLKPVQIQYYDDQAMRIVAVQSGRADAVFSVNSVLAYQSAQQGKTRLVGAISGGWPRTADIAIATRRGSGLADPLTVALNGLIKNGRYQQVLDRWNLASEAIDQSRTNPPGLPKS